MSCEPMRLTILVGAHCHRRAPPPVTRVRVTQHRHVVLRVLFEGADDGFLFGERVEQARGHRLRASGCILRVGVA